MKTVWIAMKDLLQAARDGKGLLILLVMPMILIAILGAAFGSQFAKTGGVEPFELGLVNNDRGMIAAAIENFLSSDAVAELFVTVSVAAGEAKGKVDRGELPAAVVIPPNFTSDFMAGRPVSLELFKDRGRLISPLVAESVLMNLAETMGATQLVVRQAAARGVPPAELPALGEAVAMELQALAPRLREEYSEKGSRMTSFQYYTAAMSVMFLLFAGMTGLQSIIAEQRQQTFSRMLASPLRKGQFILGKFFGIITISFVQFLILMAGTRFLYNVPWGHRPWEAAAVALSLGMALSGLALMASALIREEKTLMSVWPVSIQISSALGGSMVPLAAFPPFMQVVARFTPTYWGLQGMLQVMMGRPLDYTLLLPLLAVGLLSLAVASKRTALS